MKIVYDTTNGSIVEAFSKDQQIGLRYDIMPNDFLTKIDFIILDKVPFNLHEYFVKDKKLIEYDKDSKNDIRNYGRVLSADERILLKLEPSQKEIEKAKMQIEILSTLQEVL